MRAPLSMTTILLSASRMVEKPMGTDHHNHGSPGGSHIIQCPFERSSPAAFGSRALTGCLRVQKENAWVRDDGLCNDSYPLLLATRQYSTSYISDLCVISLLINMSAQRGDSSKELSVTVTGQPVTAKEAVADLTLIDACKQ